MPWHCASKQSRSMRGICKIERGRRLADRIPACFDAILAMHMRCTQRMLMTYAIVWPLFPAVTGERLYLDPLHEPPRRPLGWRGFLLATAQREQQPQGRIPKALRGTGLLAGGRAHRGSCGVAC